MPPRKSMKKQPNHAEPGDLERLKVATRRLLARLEDALGEEVGTEQDSGRLHERLFGTKGSLISALVTLVDVFMRLETVAKPEDLSEGDVALSDGDVALLEAFAQRIKEAENA